MPCRRRCLTGGPFIHCKLAKWEQPKGALQAKVPYRGVPYRGTTTVLSTSSKNIDPLGKVFYKRSCVHFFTRVLFCTQCTSLYTVYFFVHSVLFCTQCIFCTQCTFLYKVYKIFDFLTLLRLPSLSLSSSLHPHHLLQLQLTCYMLH